MTPENLKRTTIRLPKDLHAKLREAAYRSGTTAEEIIQRALTRELADEGIAVFRDNPAFDLYESVRKALDGFRQRTSMSLEPTPPIEVGNWSPLVAYRYLQSLPTLAVIKDDKARIVWCNVAYENTFGRTLSEMKGKTIVELGFVDEHDRAEIAEHMECVFQSDYRGFECLETVQVPDSERGDVAGDRTVPLMLRVHRFVFATKDGDRYLGDVSFDYYRCTANARGNAGPPLLTSPPHQAILGLLIPFLERCPAEISVKDRDGCFVWGNSVLLDLASANSLGDILGRTAEEIFDLEPFDPIIDNDQTIIDKKIWMCVEESLPKWTHPRTSIWFPVFADDRIQMIGVLSSAFTIQKEPTKSIIAVTPTTSPQMQPSQSRG